MTRPIGERFMYDGVLLEVVEDVDFPCAGCYFDELLDSGKYPLRRHPVTGSCLPHRREDCRSVKFKRIEEGVGE